MRRTGGPRVRVQADPRSRMRLRPKRSFLASLGAKVTFIDRDLTRLHERARSGALHIDLARDRWPFTRGSLGGIIEVHFLLPKLFPEFAASLAPGGYLLLETVPGCGHNYRELPEAGRVRQGLAGAFDFEEYRERGVGPSEADAVTVRLLARRRSDEQGIFPARSEVLSSASKK